MERPTTQHNTTKTILRGCAAARMAAQPKNTVSGAKTAKSRTTNTYCTQIALFSDLDFHTNCPLRKFIVAHTLKKGLAF